MKQFKLEAKKLAERYEIDRKTFNELTKNEYPYEQIDETSGQVRQYAVCPSCLNPIQIIGVAKKSKCNPYGKHAGKKIDGLADWNVRKYKLCPYCSKGHISPSDDYDEQLIIDDDTVEIYELMKAQFDRVVYILRKETGVYGSLAFWKASLEQYLASDGYCYPWISEINLPYIFGFRGVQHRSIIKQRILVDSDLYKALEQVDGLKFIDVKNKDGQAYADSKYKLLVSSNKYVDVQIRFTAHQQNASTGQPLRESILFCIDLTPENREVFSKKLQIDKKFFMALVKKGNETYRDKKLLALSEELMQPLSKTV